MGSQNCFHFGWSGVCIIDGFCQRRNYKKRHSGNPMKPFVFQIQEKHITKPKNKLSSQSLTCYMSFKEEMFVSASCQKIWAESHHQHLHCLCSFNSTTKSNERKENYPRNFRWFFSLKDKFLGSRMLDTLCLFHSWKQ